MIRPRLLLSAPLLAVASWAAENPRGLSAESPFAPAGGGISTSAPAAAENIEFAGVTTIGKRTELIFHDKTARRNLWLAKGEEKAGIALLNYDPQREQAVVKINGVEKVLSLRKGRGTPGPGHVVTPVPTGFNQPAHTPTALPAPAIAPAPSVAPASPPPPPATLQAKQEVEARMLVSDLLEIGMAQRKAYEEAQRRASGQTPATDPNQTPPAQPEASPRQP